MNKDNNGQICVNKGILFILLAILVVGFAVVVSQTGLLSSISQAAPRAKKCFYGAQELSTTSTPWKYDASTKCIQNATNVNTGYKCTYDTVTGNLLGKSILDPTTCPKPVAVRGCSYAGVNVDNPANDATITGYGLDGNGCVERYNKTSGIFSLTGYECVTNISGVRVSKKITDPTALCYASGVTARTACQYGGTTLPATLGAGPSARSYDVDSNGCITASGDLIGLRCDSSTNFLGKRDDACKTSVTRQSVEALVAACNDPAIKGKVGRIIVDYGGSGRNGCQLFNGYYFSTTRVNPNVTVNPIPLAEYCALESTVKTGTACGFASAAATECSFAGKLMSQWTGTYNVEAGTGCIVTTVDGYNTGYHCNGTTFKTTYNRTTCPR